MRRRAIAFPICVAFLVAGCAAGVQDATVVSFHREALSAKALNRDGIALVPVPMDAYDGDFRRDLAWELAGRIYHERPDLGLQDLDRTAGAVHDRKLDRSIVSALASFRESGEPPRAELGRIARDLGVRYLLIVLWDRWLHYETARGGREEAREPARYEVLTLIWDAGTEGIVWEATGAATAGEGAGAATLPGPHRFVQVAAKGISRALPA